MRIRASMAAAVLLVTVTAAEAQIKPMSSGQPSFNAPEMRRHGSGFRHPNRPHHRHRHHGLYGSVFGPATR